MAAPITNPYAPAPLLTDSGEVFDAKAFGFAASLEPRRQELQAQADWINTRANDVEQEIADAIAPAAQQAAQQVTQDTESAFNLSQAQREAEFNVAQTSREQQFSTFIASSGYQFAGDYDAGIEITQYNQIIRDSNGEFWRVSGQVDLPYTTTGAGLPEGGTFVAVGDAALRQELAQPDGVRLVGGAAPKSDDFTLIRERFRRVAAGAYSFAVAGQMKGVITGDSLSFNAFGYPSGWPVSGGGYATQNPFGLSSWAHMLRDLFISSRPGFIPIKDVKFDTNSGLYPGIGNDYDYGLNGRQITFNFNSGASTYLRVNHSYSGSKAILMGYAPANKAVEFDVDGVMYSNLSPDGAYQSRGYFIVPCSSSVTLIDNVTSISGGDVNLVVYGTIDASSPVTALTGKGAWTSGQILGEYSTLVAPYSPDFIMYIIGANDIGLNVPVETFASNVEAFIDLARAGKADCEILLISPPPSTSYTREKARTYIAAMREVAEAKGASLIDMHTQLEQINPSEYRFDNIHFSTQGDTLVFNIVKDLCFGTVPVDFDKFFPVREAALGNSGTFYRRVIQSSTALVILGTNITFDTLGTGSEVPTVVYTGSGTSSRVEITPPLGYIISSVQTVAVPAGGSAEITLITPVGNAHVVTVAISNAGAYVDLVNTGKYLLVSYHTI